MSAVLCPTVPGYFTSAKSVDAFFPEKAEKSQLSDNDEREQPKLGIPGESCKTNLFFGFFFDGTRNNYVQAEKGKDHSNVARLYDIFPGQSVPGVLPVETDWKYKPERYSHFFRVYIPGVASPFEAVKDSGEGWAETFGAAAGAKGCDRIVWALIQAINNVNRYFHKQPLVSSAEATSLANRISLSRQARWQMTRPSSAFTEDGTDRFSEPRIEFERLLRRLHASVSIHWSKGGRPPAKVDPGVVDTIYLSLIHI